MSDQNFNQSIKHFCGGSNATGLFMEANYHGNNYISPVNSSREPELLYGTSLENIMFAKNYKQSSKQNGMTDNDIHNQYVDFIVRSALYHRELDNPTSVGSGLESVRNSLQEAIDELLSEKLGDLQGIGNLASLLDSQAWILQSVDPSNYMPPRAPGSGHGTENKLTLRLLGITENSKFYEYLNAVLLLLSLSQNLPVGGVFPMDANSLGRSLAHGPVKLVNRTGFEKTSKAATVNGTFEDHLRKLVGDCDDAGNLGKQIFGNLCFVSKFDGNSTNAAKNIDAILRKNNKLADKKQILQNITNKMINETLQFTLSTHREIGGLTYLHNKFFNELRTNLAGGVSGPDYQKQQQFVSDTLKQILSNTNLMTSFKTNLLAGIFNVVRSLVNDKVNDAFTPVDRNSHATRLFENVFLNWQNLDREAREFYRAHVHIFRQVGNVRGQNSTLSTAQTGWEDIRDRVEDANFLRSLNRGEIRINLMKDREGSVNVLFGKTLPFLPVIGLKAIRNVWYTPANTTVPQSIPSNNLSETFLQDLYACVYNGTGCNFNGIVLNLPTNYSQVESFTQDFSIEDILVIRNFIASRKNTSVALPSANPSFDALFVEDMVSQVTWRLDEQGNLYRLENGNKIPYSPDEITIDNCVGSRLAGDRVQCSRLVRECLMSGDKNALNDCIGNMRAANMFDVAQSECQHVDPHVAVQILRTFGIGRIVTKDPILGDINVPQPFDHWKKTTLSSLRPALREAIENDNKLCDYLKGVIAFVTMNPAILNANVTQNKVSLSTQPIDDPYLNSLKKTMYVNPYETQQEQKLFTAQSLIKTIQYPQMKISSSSQVTNPFNNITYGGNGIAVPASRSLAGGAASAQEESIMRKIKRNGSTSQLISTLMDNLFEEMKNNGIPLNDIDRTRINDGINKLSLGEKTLGKYYSMLRALTDLALFFKSSGTVQHNGELKELSLDTIKSRADTLAYLYQNIGDVQNCISNGIDGQNSKCKELVDFYSVLVNDQNTNAVRVLNL